MRITNAERDGIIDQETTNKFYDKHNELEEALRAEATKQVEKTIPKEVLAFYEKYPAYFRTSCRVDLVGENMQIAREAGFRSCTLSDYYPMYSWNDVEIEVKGKIKTTLEKLIKLKADEKKFRSDLQTLLYSYTTVKKLLEVVPEFESYFSHKASAKSNAIVPINLIKDVRKNLAKRK